MSDCKGGCGGCCGSCGGCNQAMVLSPEEVDVLWQLAQIPFLPVARRSDSDEPRCFEESVTSLALQCLEKRGLIPIDYDKPLSGADMSAYAGYPVHGSFALTERGYSVLELLETQGIQ